MNSSAALGSRPSSAPPMTKIQNYVENVDKTFVFANPNKKSISIQEFERERFVELMQDIEDGDEFAETL